MRSSRKKQILKCVSTIGYSKYCRGGQQVLKRHKLNKLHSAGRSGSTCRLLSYNEKLFFDFRRQAFQVDTVDAQNIVRYADGMKVSPQWLL